MSDFAEFIKQQNSLLETKYQWVIVGGSYPGGLSAWFRSLYPELASVAWSSSGVIHAVEKFTDFDLDIYLSSLNSGSNCTETMKVLTSNIDSIFTKGDATEKKHLFDIFGNLNADIVHGDFMWFVSDIFTMGVQYGTRTMMCDLFKSSEFNKDTMQGLADYATKLKVHVQDYDADSLSNTTIDIQKNIRQWTYQYCTEFGWF